MQSEHVLRQVSILEVMSIRDRNKSRRELIDISSTLKNKLTSSYPRRVIILSKTNQY